MIYHGDLFDVLPTLAEASIDACVTDPPYGIGFMGKKWDTFSPEAAEARIVENDEIDSENPNLRGRTRGVASSPSAVEYDRSLAGQRGFQVWSESWAREVFRVLKPGAYLLVCGAPRSYHRMACGAEDAGFEIRDCFAWLFGQGYPKSVDVARAIDMALCTEDGRHCMRALPPARKRRPGDHVCAETDLGRKWAGWGSGVLDPFLGSGTTGMACRYEHREFIGIEREAEYVEIAERRISGVAPLFAWERTAREGQDPQ